MQQKVLSVKNPYAYLIIHGGKDVENRTWQTDYRGRLYIHASGDAYPFPFDEQQPAILNEALEDLIAEKPEQPYREYARLLNNFYCDLNSKYEKLGIFSENSNEDEFFNKILKNEKAWLLKSQSIIGYVDLVDIVQDSPSPWAIEGQYHWIVKNPVALEKPINNVKGKLSLWKYDIPE